MRTYVVEYQVATYQGTVNVFTWCEIDDETACARARKQLAALAPLPMRYERFTVVRVIEEERSNDE